MPLYTFDSSVIIAYRVRELPKDFVLSAVVIAELTAESADESIRRVYEAMRRISNKIMRSSFLRLTIGSLPAEFSLGSPKVGRKRPAAKPPN